MNSWLEIHEKMINISLYYKIVLEEDGSLICYPMIGDVINTLDEINFNVCDKIVGLFPEWIYPDKSHKYGYEMLNLSYCSSVSIHQNTKYFTKNNEYILLFSYHNRGRFINDYKVHYDSSDSLKKAYAEIKLSLISINLKHELNEIRNMILYLPGVGDAYYEAKKEFDSHM